MTTIKGRRRGPSSWFVEPYRQVKLGLMFIVVNLVFAAAIFGVFGYYLVDIYQAMVVYFQLTPDQGGEILNKLHTPMISAVGLILFFIIVTILLSVRYTHAIYGPLVSIHRFLDDLLEGRKTQNLVLRESDQLQELAEKLNQLAAQSQSSHEDDLSRMNQFLGLVLEANNVAPLDLGPSPIQKELASKINSLVKRAQK